MELHFLGVRGSTPAPGPEFVRYGGNTSCVAVAADGEPPTLVLDAGTGVRRLGRTAGRRSRSGARCCSPTCTGTTPTGCRSPRALDHPDATVELWLPAQRRTPAPGWPPRRCSAGP